MSSTMGDFAGILPGEWVALITPMQEKRGPCSNEIDFSKFERIIQEQADAGVRKFLVAGTTGQSPVLTDEEHFAVAKWAYNTIKRINPNFNVMIGAGSNATNQAISLSQELCTIADDIILLHVTGYYNNPNPIGLKMHYEEIAKNVKAPIVIYNVPGRTSSDITKIDGEDDISVVVSLSKINSIIGIKYARPKALHIVEEIVKNTNPEKFKVMSGNDDEYYDFLHLGAHGIISAAMNVAPKPFINIGNVQAMDVKRSEQEYINPLIKAVYAPGTKNPEALGYMFNTELRSPLLNINTFLQNESLKSFKEVVENAKLSAAYLATTLQIDSIISKFFYDESDVLLPLAKECFKERDKTRVGSPFH